MDDSKPFEYITWKDSLWKHDPQFEEELGDEPFSFPSIGQKMPGRNEKCLCGSGKKYKKCCLEKVEFMSKTFGS